MRTDERDAHPDQGPKGFGLMTHVVIVLGLLLLTLIFRYYSAPPFLT